MWTSFPFPPENTSQYIWTRVILRSNSINLFLLLGFSVITRIQTHNSYSVTDFVWNSCKVWLKKLQLINLQATNLQWSGPEIKQKCSRREFWRFRESFTFSCCRRKVTFGWLLRWKRDIHPIRRRTRTHVRPSSQKHRRTEWTKTEQTKGNHGTEGKHIKRPK